jgi:hypothetical protein
LVSFAAEILCVCILLLINRKYPFSPWIIGVFLILHYGIWVPVLWTGIPAWTNGLLAAHLLLVAFPLSGILWCLCHWTSPSGTAEENASRGTGRWTVAGAAISLAALLVIWLPGRAYGLANPRDVKSVTIQFSRGPCSGTCPSYKLVLYGSGLVDYFGGEFVGVLGQQTAVISREQLMQVLQELSRVRFFALEDRAFRWCFDTSSVGVSVSVDGRTKRIFSDGGCIGANSGVQAQFVQAANKIDKIVGSDRWVKCNGRCRN